MSVKGEIKQQSTSRGFAVLSAAGMMVKVLSLLYIPFLLRIINDEGYGVYNAAYQVYAFVYVLTNAGIPVAISKLVSEFTAVKNYRDAVKSFKIARFMLLIIGFVMSLLMIIFAYPLARVLHYDKSGLAILALSPSILFTSVASAYRGYFQGRGNMVPTAVSQVIEQIMNTIFTLVFAALLIKYGMTAGCAGGTIGTTLGALFSASYLIIFYERNKRIRVPSQSESDGDIVKHSNRQIARKIISYGVPITICVGMTYAGNLVDLMNTKVRLLAAGLTDTQATINYGYLVKYQQLLNVPIAIITALSMAILPAISGAVALKDKKLIENKINYAFRLCFIVAIPSAVGLAVLSSPIFKLLFTQRYASGSRLMLFGSAVLILTSVMQIQTTILQSVGKLYTATFYSVLGIIVKIGANYFLIAMPGINILGAIFGSIIGFSIPVFLNHKVIKKQLKIKFKFLSHAVKPFIAAAFMGLVVYIVYFNSMYILNFMGESYFANAAATIAAVIAGVYTYILGLILTGGITKGDMNSMPSKVTRLIPKFMRKRIR
jgi:stage V sporulation protein B